MKKWLWSLFILTSCASYNPGEYAHIVKGEHPRGTPINAEVDDTYSMDPFVFVNFTFGNVTKDKWTRIKSIRFTDIGGVDDARLVVGPDLAYWGEGAKRKVSIDNHNSRMFWGSITGLMMAGAVASGKSNTGLAAGLAGGSLISASILDINALMNRVSSLELSALVPPTHLYQPFSVPPGLYLARWVVFEVPSGKKIKFLEFEVEYLSGKKATYRVEVDSTEVRSTPRKRR